MAIKVAFSLSQPGKPVLRSLLLISTGAPQLSQADILQTTREEGWDSKPPIGESTLLHPRSTLFRNGKAPTYNYKETVIITSQFEEVRIIPEDARSGSLARKTDAYPLALLKHAQRILQPRSTAELCAPPLSPGASPSRSSARTPSRSSARTPSRSSARTPSRSSARTPSYP
ncbi:hypothetical protein DACRYDRAFT_119606 [Dacryopinax primogenitus]|uniref:Uncharacterized protein n=1 Tax=Dacryopinax primogenitus (strain DJM 731) TaxID=1858805 RepID=M5FPK6_DACPD|nr:uncharacterized protein DACRYDRAFT_119606 [Dacryopinax primogenitus]EJT97133.1 hypothetical protein DACRYDRAFT_119606 [Dacryopinax primogenitus]